ncbi:MAG: hypothetical protein ACOC95_05020 [Planctomycetota bacterium]
MSERPTVPSRRLYGSVHYVVAACALLLAGGGMVGLKRSGFVMAKAKVTLNKPLDAFPETVGTRFALWRDFNRPDVQQGKVQLTDDIVKVLGTEQFISWYYVDRERSTPGATAFVLFHAAYYTGLLDATPHVPENCMVAGGRLPDDDHSGQRRWQVNDLPEVWADWEEVEVRRAAFVKRDDPRPVFSYYIFCANGEPMWNRNSVRMRMSDPFEKHCYYMKIEVTAGRSDQPLTPEESDEMCRAFFAEAVPLVLQHVATPAELEAMEDAP